MKKQSFIKLLRKFLNGKATPEEEQFLISYYTLFESEPDVVSLLEKEQQEELGNTIFSEISDQIRLQERKILPIYQRIPYASAAAILLVAALTAIFFFKINIPDEVHQTTFLNGTPSNQLVNLGDGSSILLSPGSKVTYPISFSNLRRREVTLDGEAFFDVKRDSLKPFIIHTGKINTRVLGTSFNIRALAGDPNVTVTVMRGKVEVAENSRKLGQLRPSEQIRYNNSTYRTVRSVVDTTNYLAWKSPLLLFDNMTVKEACRILSERYKVDIRVDDPKLAASRFTTKFYKTESLDNVLESLCEFNNAAFRYRPGTNIVTLAMKSNSHSTR